MQWFARLMTSAAAMLLTVGGAGASTKTSDMSVDTAWDIAVKSDSLEAYAEFVMMYPESAQARSAYDRLSGIADSPAASARAPLFTGDDESSPAMLPGMIMII